MKSISMKRISMKSISTKSISMKRISMKSISMKSISMKHISMIHPLRSSAARRRVVGPGQARHLCLTATLLGFALTAASLTAAPSAAKPRVLGTQPVQNGELVGNTVMFVGYDLAESGTTPKVEVVNESTKVAVPIRVTSRCKKGRTATAPRRCNVLVRLMKWDVGHHYRAVLHGHTLKFTIVAGDPGMPRKPRKQRPKK